MSKPKQAEDVNLIMSIFSPEASLIVETIREISARYGKPDFVSTLLKFDFTNYYHQEMGSPLLRRFVSFAELVRPDFLPDIKLDTNSVEERFVTGGKRKINIDPGYISSAHLVLATGKGYTHRPYLREGIYADLTLIYTNKSFSPLPWTYPDYAREETIAMLNNIRGRYMIKLKAAEKKVDENSTRCEMGLMDKL